MPQQIIKDRLVEALKTTPAGPPRPRALRGDAR